jgi:hypothetical protein
MELATQCREGTWSCDVDLAGRQGVLEIVFRRFSSYGRSWRTPSVSCGCDGGAFSSAFGGLRLFPPFASAMTLEMTLNANIS